MQRMRKGCRAREGERIARWKEGKEWRELPEGCKSSHRCLCCSTRLALQNCPLARGPETESMLR